MRRLAIFLIALAVFAGDRIAGHAVATTMVPGQSIEILPPVLSLTYVLNTGAAFSLLPHDTWLFDIIGAAVVLGMIGYVWQLRSLNWGWTIGLGLLAGGT
ncbi:MAG: signal peptidase II, partial [Firmicutes bacterium]|nr:signal peptidase II [Bacillota bacterium]